MDLLSDWWLYNSCYEIPRNYAFWTIIGVTGAVMHKKLLYKHADLHFTATLYVGLIGKQGGSKSTAMSFGRNLYEQICPEIEIGPSRTSPEQLVSNLAADETLCEFTNHEGAVIEVHPCPIFINEFKNFLGRSPVDMINLLTDIYDVPYYRGACLARGKEPVKNPAINIIMCETPNWMIDNLRGNLITGGIARRFVLVFEDYCDQVIPIPFITPEAFDARERVKQRLTDIRSDSALYKWGDGESDYRLWYEDNKRKAKKERIEMMQGYLGTKPTQLFKLMMILDATSDKPMRVFSKELLDLAVPLLDVLEVKMPELGQASGRNELMASQNRLMAVVRSSVFQGITGWIQKKKLEREIQTDLDPNEQYQIFRFLQNSEQIFIGKVTIQLPDGKQVEKEMVMIPETYEVMKKKGVIK